MARKTSAITAAAAGMPPWTQEGTAWPGRSGKVTPRQAMSTKACRPTIAMLDVRRARLAMR